MSYDWGRTMNENTDKPYAWQAVGGTIWNHKTSEDDVPLYTKPQWQGLTVDEILAIPEYGQIAKELKPIWSTMLLYYAKAIEAKLKEKNGG
jgi:hypothetical protein